MQALKNAAFAPEGHIFDCFPQKPRISDGVTEDRVYRKVKAGDMIAGAWLSMNGTLGQWGRDVAGMVSDFGEQIGNLFSGDGFKTDGEIEAVQWALMTAGLDGNSIQLATNDGGWNVKGNMSKEEIYNLEVAKALKALGLNNVPETTAFDRNHIEKTEELITEGKYTGKYNVSEYNKDGTVAYQYVNTTFDTKGITYDTIVKLTGGDGDFSQADMEWYALSQGAKLDAYMNLKQVNGNNYETTLNGAKLSIPADAWESARNSGYSMDQVMERMDPSSMGLLFNLIEENDVASMKFSSLFRPNEYAHGDGLGLDITEITSKSKISAVFNNEVGGVENNYTKQIREWFGEQSNVKEILSPWKMKWGNSGWISNNWQQNTWRRFYDKNKETEFIHRNHLHVTVKP